MLCGAGRVLCVVCCVVFVVRCLLRRSVFLVRGLSVDGCCVLFVVWLSCLCVVRWLLVGVRCLLLVLCSLMRVV